MGLRSLLLTHKSLLYIGNIELILQYPGNPTVCYSSANEGSGRGSAVKLLPVTMHLRRF
jgi:hypothetical protein